MSDFKISGKLNYFLEMLEGIEDALPSLKNNFQDEFKKKKKACSDYVEKHGEAIERGDDGGIVKFRLSRARSTEFKKLRKDLSKSGKLAVVLPQNFLVAIVSEYDAYLGDLIREIYNNKPERVSGLEKEFTFRELMEFTDLDEVKDFVIEKDIETTLRKSHLEQLHSLEKKFGIELTKGLGILPDFIEITERRNLFVHCKGVVSAQYIKICKDNGVELKEVEVGKKLFAQNDYIFKAIHVFSEIAIKLTHVLWNKVFKEDSEKIGESMQDISYELLVREKYKLVNDITPLFLSKPFQSIDDIIKRGLLINNCIAFKELGDNGKAMSLLNSQDWSATTPILKMAQNIIKDEDDLVFHYMNQAMKMEELKKEYIDEWPLFNHIKKKAEFKKLYVELFGEEEIIDVSISNKVSIGVNTGKNDFSKPVIKETVTQSGAAENLQAKISSAEIDLKSEAEVENFAQEEAYAQARADALAEAIAEAEAEAEEEEVLAEAMAQAEADAQAEEQALAEAIATYEEDAQAEEEALAEAIAKYEADAQAEEEALAGAIAKYDEDAQADEKALATEIANYEGNAQAEKENLDGSASLSENSITGNNASNKVYLNQKPKN
ncbi:hypothetical protein RIN65_08375 [Pantoea agglomerans]|uniref:hypothetical protein n=1 Tax=Enterobacter agglomerans TaxID=549 RepID=UPI0028C4C141|nr:hypothetical protein [Pantoea agglomerans]WNN36115.1 hypothetical protein RIN65_08375 [Pantoea agglomerans]